MIFIIAILTSLTLATAAGAIYTIQGRNRKAASRLQRVVDGSGTVTMTVPDMMDYQLPFMAHVVGFFAWIFPTQMFSETLQWDLARAGFRHPDVRKVFTGSRVLATATFGLVAWRTSTL